MKLDTVLTIAVGRNDQDGNTMGTADWAAFQDSLAILVGTFGTIVANTTGDAIGSDGVNEGQDEDTNVIVAINVTDVDSLRRLVAGMLFARNCSSACFAFDGAHEPVFATASGFRLSEVSA